MFISASSHADVRQGLDTLHVLLKCNIVNTTHAVNYLNTTYDKNSNAQFFRK